MEKFLYDVVSPNVAEPSRSESEQSRSVGQQSASDSPQSPSAGDQSAPDSQQPSSDDGYGTQSNASYLEEGADAMYDYPLRQLPEAQLKEYENTLKDMVRHPIEVDQEHDNPRSAAHRQITHDR